MVPLWIPASGSRKPSSAICVCDCWLCCYLAVRVCSADPAGAPGSSGALLGEFAAAMAQLFRPMGQPFGSPCAGGACEYCWLLVLEPAHLVLCFGCYVISVPDPLWAFWAFTERVVFSAVQLSPAGAHLPVADLGEACCKAPVTWLQCPSSPCSAVRLRVSDVVETWTCFGQGQCWGPGNECHRCRSAFSGTTAVGR